MGKWRKSGPSVDSICLEIVLNSGFASKRSNSLSTRGCGESRQTCNAFFLAGFFTDFEIIGTVNTEQGSFNGKLRRRTMATEWRIESPKTGRRERQTLTLLFETERVEHPQKPNQSLGVDVLEWYDPTVRVRQQKKTRKGV